MRRLFLQVLIGATFAAAIGSESFGQTTLSTGDVQILGVTSDDADSFSFVLWRDIASGTVVRFMDHSFTNGTTDINYTEQSMSLTFNSNLSAGTVIRVVDNAATLANGVAFIGTKTGTLSGISTDGDQIFAFQGIEPSSTNFSGRTLLYGINVANTNWLTSGTADSNSSYLPSSLSGVNANFDSGNFDNVDYAGARTGMTTEAYRAAISNSVNYTQNNTRFNLSTTGFNRESSANLFWDANGSNAGNGGDGVWDATTQSRFKNATEGTTFLRWVNSSTGNDHTAVFGGSVGTVSVAASGVTASGLDFQTNGYAVNNNTINLVGTAPTINAASSVSASIGSVLTGSAGITKTGSGTVTLTGANTYTGGTTISQGTLQLSGSGTLGADTNTLTVNGGTMDFNGQTRTIGSLAGSGGTITSATEATLTVGNGGASATNASTISGALSLVKSGVGTQTLAGANTYTGATTINNGTLRLDAGNDRLPTGTVVSLGQASSSNLGTLDLNGRNQTIAGLQSISGTNTGTSTNVVTSATSAVLTINNSDNFIYGAGTAANSGVISGTISLVKGGLGTQTLTGANAYTGTTTINAGTLLVNGTHTGGGAYTVNAGGTLGGLGTIAANVNLFGGTLSAGNSIGTMTVNGGLNFDSNSNLIVEFNSSLLSGLTISSDLLTVNGAVQLNNANLVLSDLSLSSAIAPLGSSFTFLTANAGLTGRFSNFADGGVVDIRGNQWRINYGSNSISFSAVPEPSSLALLGLVGIGGFTFRRLRNKKNRLPEIVG
jgi:autotransporter-associated beta strand protein